MNVKLFSIVAASLVVLGSCDDKLENNIAENPVQTGEEINFGSSLTQGIQTRTVYGDEVTTGGELGNGYFPVYWSNDPSNLDQIAILCPQASNGTRVDYEITPNEQNQTTSTDVTKIHPDKAGLQWGSEDLHQFYGFYPAEAAIDNTNDGVVTVNIPTIQNPVRWERDEDGTIVGIGNTDYAYMWAYTAVKRSETEQGEPIPLRFEPMSTVLEITINGPKTGNMALSSVNVRSIDQTGTGEANTVLTGEVQCDIRPAAEGKQAVCTPAGDMNAVRNQIFINLYGAGAYDNSEGGNGYPILGPGDKLKVYAYLLPKDEDILKGTIQISVSPVNQGNKVKTLSDFDIVAHAINKVSLPALEDGSETNYWMSSMDPDVYYSELSLPGSKMSAVSPSYGAGGLLSYITQSSSLTEQFNLGVRAFDFKTMVQDGWGGDNEIHISPEMLVTGTWTSLISLQQAINELSACLEAAETAGKEQESVFVNLSYAASRLIINNTEGRESTWVNRLIETINGWNNDRIYTQEITSNTTIGDVKGKIILRVRVQTEGAYNLLSTSIPAQLVRYSDPYVTEPIHMAWGTYDNENGLNLLYHETGRIEDSDNSEAGFNLTEFDGTRQTKKDQVAYLVNRSAELYNANNNHDTWFLIDLGGYYSRVLGVVCDAQTFTSDMMPYFFEYFNTRSQNAALGVVLMNFADNNENYGQTYGTANLIQTVIDNNFSFQLRTRGNTAPLSTVTRSSNPDGWDE